MNVTDVKGTALGTFEVRVVVVAKALGPAPPPPELPPPQPNNPTKHTAANQRVVNRPFFSPGHARINTAMLASRPPIAVGKLSPTSLRTGRLPVTLVDIAAWFDEFCGAIVMVALDVAPLARLTVDGCMLHEYPTGGETQVRVTGLGVFEAGVMVKGSVPVCPILMTTGEEGTVKVKSGMSTCMNADAPELAKLESPEYPALKYPGPSGVTETIPVSMVLPFTSVELVPLSGVPG